MVFQGPELAPKVGIFLANFPDLPCLIFILPAKIFIVFAKAFIFDGKLAVERSYLFRLSFQRPDAGEKIGPEL